MLGKENDRCGHQHVHLERYDPHRFVFLLMPTLTCYATALLSLFSFSRVIKAWDTFLTSFALNLSPALLKLIRFMICPFYSISVKLIELWLTSICLVLASLRTAYQDETFLLYVNMHAATGVVAARSQCSSGDFATRFPSLQVIRTQNLVVLLTRDFTAYI